VAASALFSGGVSAPPIFVIGHKNPDTDAICAAVGYADYLRRTRHPEAVAASCGVANARTKWALQQAGVEAPRLLMDVRPTAATICRRDVVLARPDDSFLDVYRFLTDRNLRSLPVVDGNGRVLGMPTLGAILNLLFPGGGGRPIGDRRVHTSLVRIRAVLGASVECGQMLTTEEDLVLMVAASSEETNARAVARLPVGQVLVIVGDRPNIHRQVIESGVRAVLLTGGFEFDPELTRLARDRAVALLRCTQDTATTVGLIRCSRRVSDVLDSEFLSFGAGELVSSVLRAVQDSHQPLFPVVDEETRVLIGVFSKSDLVELPRTRLVLVDHNEFSQAVTGADEAEILEVLDHHRLSGNLVSREPLRFINEPVGSTCTIVAQFFQISDLEPSRETAICLMAGLISDTLKLSSPTTTDTDRRILPWLAGHAGLDVDAFTRGFFEAGSTLKEFPPTGILGADRKEYVEAGWRVSISQIEELGLETFPEREKELQSALAALRSERTLDVACLLVTDITRHRSLLLVDGDPRVIDAIDYPRLRKNVFDLEGVVSRKKQFFPYLSNRLARIDREAEARQG
jgi:manganese-dependent inorganic pyrophosphatase